jgi:hypothetical protein
MAFIFLQDLVLKSVRVSSHLSSKLNQKKPIFWIIWYFISLRRSQIPKFVGFFCSPHMYRWQTKITLDLKEMVVVKYGALRELRIYCILIWFFGSFPIPERYIIHAKMLLLSNLNYKNESKRLNRSRVKSIHSLVKYQISIHFHHFMFTCSLFFLSLSSYSFNICKF